MSMIFKFYFMELHYPQIDVEQTIKIRDNYNNRL